MSAGRLLRERDINALVKSPPDGLRWGVGGVRRVPGRCGGRKGDEQMGNRRQVADSDKSKGPRVFI